MMIDTVNGSNLLAYERTPFQTKNIQATQASLLRLVILLPDGTSI